VAIILALPTFTAKKQKKFEIILENNLPKGTLKLHNTTKSIDVLTSRVMVVWSGPSVAEDIVCCGDRLPHSRGLFN